jgi:MFS family permease
MAAPPLGTVIGLFALGRLRMPVQRRLVAPLSIGTGLSVLLACLAAHAPGADGIVLVLLFVCGACVAYINTIQSEISRMIATSLRGRVFGLANAVMQISQGLAITLAGLLAGTGQLTLAIAIIAAALTVITVVVLRLRPKRSRAMTMSPA